ncbi:MAG TPA: hypothetical protein VGL93_12270 [Streptosporangiaceae bacterium]|jgi:hypothetical protein
MDAYEIARRANELPSGFQDRLSVDAYEDVHRSIDAGEWGEGLDNLLAGLHQSGATITADEHRRLAELMRAINMPPDRLDRLTVH